MKHAAAVHFLEMAVGRLDATLTAMEVAGEGRSEKFKEMSVIKAQVQDSIQTLMAIGWVEDKADEIRRREGKPPDPAQN